MSQTLVAPKKYKVRPVTVDAMEYDGTGPGAVEVAIWVRSFGGTLFAADELLWRHDFGSYYHPEHGMVYLPGATRNPNGKVGGPGPRELVVKTGLSAYALVFPGDFIIQGPSGFYPLSAESFHRTHRPKKFAGERT
ncbi:hypothetical protein SEA_PUREGLOBE5_10 [Arthrobacter phage Pureglobe5]|nr:hypothetical protein PBI_BEAGLE_10 [Arthrobacter phage Beagle]QOP66873.1 hypothetical protein SEA_ODYSSEY395_10 [Arthrobacter phage Odyssey395]UYL87373.1 hypothetical protein SEA_PUREGLOBE5_10 [Arthrobacter phage Pureglobe5]